MTMSYESIRVEQLEPHIIRLSVERPETLNALNAQVLGELRAAAQELATREDVAAVILTGSGRAFVAGADIKAMSQMTLEQAQEFGQLGHDAMKAIEALPMPTLAALNGFALGGGLELALSCDLIYASTKAKLGLPEVGLGLIPGFGGTQRLSRRISPQAARELVFTGATLDAHQAQALGLVLRVVEPDALEPTCLEVARAIAARGPRAVRVAKDVMARGADVTLEQGLALEQAAFAQLFDSDEPRVGMGAFLQKATPNFRG